MPRLHTTKQDVEPARNDDVTPEQASLSEAEQVVPSSFAEWLAQPSNTITAGPEMDQGVFVGLLNQCQVQVSHHQSVRPRAQ